MGVHRISLVTDPVLRALIHNTKNTRKKEHQIKKLKKKRKEIRGKQERQTIINNGTASFHSGVDPLPTATTNSNEGDRRDG